MCANDPRNRFRGSDRRRFYDTRKKGDWWLRSKARRPHLAVLLSHMQGDQSADVSESQGGEALAPSGEGFHDANSTNDEGRRGRKKRVIVKTALMAGFRSQQGDALSAEEASPMDFAQSTVHRPSSADACRSRIDLGGVFKRPRQGEAGGNSR